MHTRSGLGPRRGTNCTKNRLTGHLLSCGPLETLLHPRPYQRKFHQETETMSAPNEQSFQAPPPPPMPESAPRAPHPTKLRPVAVGLIVLGVIVLVGGIAKFIPGGIGTGGAICFAGVLLFVLSFVPLP